VLWAGAVQASGPRYLPLSFDAHDKRSLAIVGLKPEREPRPAPPFSLRPQSSEHKTSFELSAKKGVMLKLRF
jgi:hypothetical protein